MLDFKKLRLQLMFLNVASHKKFNSFSRQKKLALFFQLGQAA